MPLVLPQGPSRVAGSACWGLRGFPLRARRFFLRARALLILVFYAVTDSTVPSQCVCRKNLQPRAAIAGRVSDGMKDRNPSAGSNQKKPRLGGSGGGSAVPLSLSLALLRGNGPARRGRSRVQRRRRGQVCCIPCRGGVPLGVPRHSPVGPSPFGNSHRKGGSLPHRKVGRSPKDRAYSGTQKSPTKRSGKNVSGDGSPVPTIRRTGREQTGRVAPRRGKPACGRSPVCCCLGGRLSPLSLSLRSGARGGNRQAAQRGRQARFAGAVLSVAASGPVISPFSVPTIRRTGREQIGRAAPRRGKPACGRSPVCCCLGGRLSPLSLSLRSGARGGNRQAA